MQIEKLCINCMCEKNDVNAKCPHCGFESQDYQVSANHLPPFTILNGKYLLGRVVGEGGFGIVYIARDLYLNVIVAIKELFPAHMMSRIQSGYTQELSVSYLQSGDYVEAIKKKFIQEAQTIAQLQTTAKEGITNVKDFFEENGTAYMVMEYLDGESLKSYLNRNEKIDFATMIKMMKPVISSLIKIHDIGIIHRDISPDNIMLLGNGDVKLIDFGGVKDVVHSTYKSEVIQVKKGYTPIEQYQLEGNVGSWTDIYALCATIYRCITGKLLQEPMEIVKEGVVPPSQLGVKIPRKAEAALMKGLQVDYTKRTKNLQELYNAFYNDENTSAEAKPTKKKKKWPIVAAAVVILGGIGTCAGMKLMQIGPFENKQAGTSVKGIKGYYEIDSVTNESLCWTVKEDYLTGAFLAVGSNEILRNQCFEIIEIGEDQYSILNANTGMALTLKEDPILGTTEIVQQDLQDVKEQTWKIEHDGETNTYLFSQTLSDGSIGYMCSENLMENADIVLMEYDEKNADCYRWKLAGISEDSFSNRIASIVQGDIVALANNIYIFENNGEVLGIEGNYTNDGLIVNTDIDYNNNYQKFNVMKGDDGYYTLAALHSNLLIGTPDDNSEAGSGLIQMVNVDSSGNQKWEFVYVNVDQVIIRNQNGLCIGRGSDSKQSMLYDYDVSNENIIWTVSPTTVNEFAEAAIYKEPPLGSEVEISEGTYFIRSCMKDNAVIGVEGGYSDEGMVLRQVSFEERNSNKFFFVRGANNNFAIVAAHTNMYMGVDENGILHQYSLESIGGEEAAAQWQLQYGGIDTYLITNTLTGKYICNDGGEETEIFVIDYDTENQGIYWKIEWTEADANEAAPMTKFEATTPVGSVIDMVEGTYLIQTQSDENMLLGIEEGYGDVGIPLICTDYNEQNSNKFYLVKGVDEYSSYYALRATHTNMYIAPDTDGNLCQLSEGTEADIYRWQILFSGKENIYFIQDIVSGNCIGSHSGSFASGENTSLVSIDTGNPSIYWRLIWTERNEQEKEPIMKAEDHEIGEVVVLQEGCYNIFSRTNSELVLSVINGYWDDYTEIICANNEMKNSQRFFVVNDSEAYSIYAAHTNKRLVLNSDSGYLCQYYQEAADSATTWEFVYAGEGSYFIRNKDGNCLDLENDTATVGNKIVLAPFNQEDDGQKWYLQWSEFNSDEIVVPMYEGDFVYIQPALYEFSSMVNSNACWAFAQDETGGQLISWERVYDATQQFYFEEVEPFSDDVAQKKYRIMPANTDKALTVNEDGAVIAMDWTGESNQLWQVVYGGFGTYCVRAEDGRFITSWDASFSNGGALSVKSYEELDPVNFKWFISRQE